MDLSVQEESEMYSEANQALQALKKHLGACTFSPGLHSQYENKMENIKKLELKRRNKQSLISVFKSVLQDEANNGFANLPEKVVRDLQDSISIAEIKEAEDSNKILQQITLPALQNFITNKFSNIVLYDQQKSFLLQRCQNKYKELKQFIPQDGLSKLKYLNKKLIETNYSFGEERLQFHKNSKKHDILEENVAKIKNKKHKFDDLSLQVKKSKIEVDIEKAKIADVRLAQGTYGGLKGEAYKKLLSRKQTVLDEFKSKNEHLANRLDCYSSLPKQDFQPLILENQKLSKDLEHAKWSIKKLEEQDD